MQRKVYILGRFHKDALHLLKQQPSFLLQTNSETALSPKMKDAEALVIRSKSLIHPQNIAEFKQLKYIVTATSGFDHIDYQYCNKNSITIEYCPDANADSAAELCFAHMLQLSRKLCLAQHNIYKDTWQKFDTGFELKNKKLLIIGLGRIGKNVAQIAAAFGMQISFYDPYVQEQCGYKKALHLLPAIEDADIISLHTPKTKKTAPLLKLQDQKHFRSGQTLINIARGDAIEEKLLEKLIDMGVLLGLDVFLEEPLANTSSLVAKEKLSLSPHIGAYTEEAFRKSSMMAAKKLIDYFNGKEPSHKLPPDAPWVQDVDS